MSPSAARGWSWRSAPAGCRVVVRKTPTGLPDWTSSVSSFSSRWSSATIASKASQERAARPVPPYTTRLSGSSATSGSRLFMSIRRAASCCHPLQESSVPRGARTVRGPLRGERPSCGDDTASCPQGASLNQNVARDAAWPTKISASPSTKAALTCDPRSPPRRRRRRGRAVPPSPDRHARCSGCHRSRCDPRCRSRIPPRRSR